MTTLDPVLDPKDSGGEDQELLRITHISLNTSDEVGDTHGFVFGVRVVPAGREGSVVFGRTLRPGEPDDGQAIELNPRNGEKLRFPGGAIRITLDELDSYARDHGYQGATRTLWAWFGFVTGVSEHEFLYGMAAARRLDISQWLHDRIEEILVLLEDQQVTGIRRQELLFEVIGAIEVLVIALHRAVKMVSEVAREFDVPSRVPDELIDALPRIASVRHAYEHVEERALGLVRGKPHPDALTGFDFSRFFADGTVQFGDARVVVGDETEELLLKAREHLLLVVAMRCGEVRVNSGDITFFE